MKLVSESYHAFLQKLNEAVGNFEYSPSLKKSATLIMSYLNKNTKMDLKMFPWPMEITVEGRPATVAMLYSDNSMEAVGVVQGGMGTVVDSIVYWERGDESKASFVVSSDDFPIVRLLGEVARLINDPKYVNAVNETLLSQEGMMINEAKSFTDATMQEIIRRIEGGESARIVANDLGLPYRKVLKLSKNVEVKIGSSEIEAQANMTLEDKVKYLDELLEDVYAITGRIAAGAPGMNSLFISGRAGTGKTFNVEKALTKEGMREGDDFVVVKGAASVVMVYKTLFQFNGKVIVFDDCDSVFKDPDGRNLFKAALDSKKVRVISYLKKSSIVYDVKDMENKPEDEFNAREAGLVPNRFDFDGRIIFISNLNKDKADPDGAIRSRSILIDIDPDDATLMERMKTLLPHLDPIDMPLSEKEEIFEFMQSAKDISMRTFVKAAGFKMAGLKNWKRMAERYL